MHLKRALLACGIAVLGSSYLQAASFMATSQSAIYDPSSGLVTFDVIFNQTPDFFTIDSFGRPATEFQYYIIGDSALAYPANFDSIIRGGEIYLGGGLPIRNVYPSSSDPHSGGWGTIRGIVPFTLVGTDLTFSVPLSLISDHSTDGHFSYNFGTYVFGATTQFLPAQQSTVLPEPAMLLFCVLWGCVGSFRDGGASVRHRRLVAIRNQHSAFFLLKWVNSALVG